MTAPALLHPGCYVGGQPTPEHLAELAGAGVRTVINLRGTEEALPYPEAAEAARLGLRYESLPITGPADLDVARVQRFGALLAEARSAGGVFIHCASSNRVGAMLALDDALNHGAPPAQAMALGRRAGLASLEPAVQALIARETAR